MVSFRTLGAVTLLTRLAMADTCSWLEENTDIDVSRPLTLSYITEQNEYWSTSCAALKPSCIIFPKTSQEVATVMVTISDSGEDFAVKSGGHNPNDYWASVEGGPLLSTAKLDQVELDQETGIVDIGPGQRLDSVAEALDGTGWTFVGGRIGNTGVGGLVLGGGLSYMSAQYGWSASSVIEFEVVLSNGTVTIASETSQVDMYKALKGGGNNFGVVTRYRLQTYRQGDVWGGNLVFLRSSRTDERILKAVRDFTEYNEDHKAAVIVTAERANLNLVDTWILFLFYDGPSPPAGTFSNFTDIGPTLNTARTRTYADLMKWSNWVIVPGSIVTIGVETIPLPTAEASAEVMNGLHAHWRNISSSTLLIPGIIASIAYQPFPKAICAEALARGDDLIACEPDAHRMIIEMNYSFILPSDHARIDRIMQETYGGVRDRIVAWQEDGTLPSGVYLPLFMNYGYNRQDYFARLKPENAQFARDVAAAVDPDGVFRDRTGGWKP